MSEIDPQLLERYLADEVTTDERERVEAWLAEDPDHWSQLTALRDARAQAALSEPAVDQAKADVWARLERERGRAGVPPQGRRPVLRDLALPARHWSTAVQIAAAVLVTLAGAAAVGALLFRSHSQAAVPAPKVATTARGQRATFRLPDGTHVMLGVASTLRYPASFDGGSRELSLEGEAYFEVVHDEQRPFVVRAGDLVARDIGTEFTVRAYPDEARARVVVRQGRVAIQAAGAAPTTEKVVAAGQLGGLRAGQAPVVEAADTAAAFAWTQGRLVFDRTPLREALPQLSRWFDLDFRLADSALGDVPLSATFTTQPTPDVLGNLAASLGMRERREGRTVTLYAADSVR
jgi:transmembrane sensor